MVEYVYGGRSLPAFEVRMASTSLGRQMPVCDCQTKRSRRRIRPLTDEGNYSYDGRVISPSELRMGQLKLEVKRPYDDRSIRRSLETGGQSTRQGEVKQMLF